MTIQCMIDNDFIIDKQELGYIKKVCTIMPKVKEFNVINGLQSSSLFKSIIEPGTPSKPWNSDYPSMNRHDMISICQHVRALFANEFVRVK